VNGLWPEVEAITAERAAGTLDDAALGVRLFHLRRAIYAAPLPAGLGAALWAPVSSAFGQQRIRLRSSTNVEDLPGFSGAGLYTSVGVELSQGQAAFERGLKVVWASAYNPAAFVEREFYRVVERGVRMGVLMHPNIADEAANGVALTQNQYDEIRSGYVIDAQVGDISVTNPSGAATPEQVLYYPAYSTPEYEVLSRSSLTGGAPVLTTDQYAQLAEALRRLRNHFNPIWCQIPGTTELDPACALDVEWKLDAAGVIVIKQARPLRAATVVP
jgi:phosphoenolpyruvate synthase/pyruvate phosphate dikinase